MFYDGTDIILHVFCFHQWKWRFSLKSSNVFDFSPISWMNLMKISISIDENKIHAWFCPFHEKNVIFRCFASMGRIPERKASKEICLTTLDRQNSDPFACHNPRLNCILSLIILINNWYLLSSFQVASSLRTVPLKVSRSERSGSVKGLTTGNVVINQTFGLWRRYSEDFRTVCPSRLMAMTDGDVDLNRHCQEIGLISIRRPSSIRFESTVDDKKCTGKCKSIKWIEHVQVDRKTTWNRVYTHLANSIVILFFSFFPLQTRSHTLLTNIHQEGSRSEWHKTWSSPHRSHFALFENRESSHGCPVANIPTVRTVSYSWKYAYSLFCEEAFPRVMRQCKL